MNISVFYKNLTVEEKFKLMHLLDEEDIHGNSDSDIISNWIINHKHILSGRLLNLLNELQRNGYKLITHIDEEDFLKIRNAGLKTWNEFISVRGY